MSNRFFNLSDSATNEIKTDDDQLTIDKVPADNQEALDKITEAADLPLWDGEAWPGTVGPEGPPGPQGEPGVIPTDPEFNTITVGDVLAGNTSNINDKGLIINHGDGRTWNDLPPIPLLVQRQGSANNPPLANFLDNIEQLTFRINDYVYGNYEIMHEYAEGTDIEPHIHFVTNGVDGTDREVRWELEYTIANADAHAPFESAFPATQTIFSQTTIPANTPNRSHILSIDFPAIPGAGLKIGAYLCWRLRRVASVGGTAPTANPFGLTMGFHILQNTQGSDEIGRKLMEV